MSELVINPLELQWHGRGLDGRTIDMKAKLKDGVLVLRPRLRDWREWVVWASGKSQYYASKLLNQVFNATAYTFPTSHFYALSTGTLSATSTGSAMSEATYTGYGRVSVTVNTSDYSTSAGGSSITNSVAVTFAANGGTAQAVTGVAICDATTAGNVIYWATITSTTINGGDTPQINASALTASEA